MSGVHLADFNVARLRAPIDDPMIDEFRENLERINGLADGPVAFHYPAPDYYEDLLTG